MTQARGVDAVDRALNLLECFTAGTKDRSLADLAKATGEHKSTILRMIVSLERFGYLIRGEDGRYRLGASVWRLGIRYRDSFDITEFLRPELHDLAGMANETASYFIREGESRVCLLRSEPARAIRHTLTVGARMPLTRGASGRVLLAFSGDPSPHSAAVRDAGFAVSYGERDPEVAAVAVPILSGTGNLMGALAISGLVTRFDKERQATLIAELFRCQKRLRDRVP